MNEIERARKQEETLASGRKFLKSYEETKARLIRENETWRKQTFEIPPKLTKVCSKCGVEKGLEAFHKHKHARFGVRPRCKECRFEDKLVYRQKNREKVRESERAYREKNREKLREKMRAYYKQNRERFSQWGRANCERLTDTYVKNNLKHLGTPNPSPNDIEVKRTQIKLWRLVKQLEGA